VIGLDNTRYFHSFGLSQQVNGKWVPCEGYTGERYTLPMRVTIPQGDLNETTADDLADTQVKHALHRSDKYNMPKIENVIEMYNNGKSFSYIGSHYRQHPSTIRQMLEQAGLVTETGRRKKGAKVNG